VQLVVQKVLSASVTVGPSTDVGQAPERIAAIGPGFLVLVGIAAGDTDADCDRLAKKIVSLRLFPGEGGKINDRTVLQVGGAVLVVSQFTLLGSVEGGSRPDYTAAAPKEEAERLYARFVDGLRDNGVSDVQTGRFGAYMAVESVNDGPVTLLLR
jgi:D-tyrosyl-tRNA(Tyr) deacylase